MAQRRRTLTCQCKDPTSSSYNVHEKPHVVVDACNLSTVCMWQRIEVLDKRISGPAELQVQKTNVFQGSIVDSNRILTTCAPAHPTHIHTHTTYKTPHQFELTINLFLYVVSERLTIIICLFSFTHLYLHRLGIQSTTRFFLISIFD